MRGEHEPVMSADVFEYYFHRLCHRARRTVEIRRDPGLEQGSDETLGHVVAALVRLPQDDQVAAIHIDFDAREYHDAVLSGSLPERWPPRDAVVIGHGDDLDSSS